MDLLINYGTRAASGGGGGTAWSNQTNNIIGWIIPGGTNTTFAAPSNGSIGTWAYSDNNGSSWTTFGGTGGFVSAVVIHNGITYSGYTHSSPWTTGNPGYIHRVTINGVNFISGGNEVFSRNASLWTGTKV
jgi:hypothetical protein